MTELCNYVIQITANGSFNLSDLNKKWETIYGIKTIRHAYEEMESLNGAKDEQQLTHFISMVQYEAAFKGEENARN